MRRNFLKRARTALAVVVFAALGGALIDFRNLLPAWVGHRFAQIQFIPSLIALLAGASFSAACIFIVLLTMAGGRIYCSTLCPLGIFQDIISRVIGLFQRKPRPTPYSKPHNVLRWGFVWGTIVAAILGYGVWALALVDPYSNFGRIAVNIFRPLLTQANNFSVGVAGKWGWQGIFRVDTHWAGLGALQQPLLLLALVTVLVFAGGRLYCNTLCPVGTILGWLGQRAMFRLQIDPDTCQKCGKCLRACKAHCIDLRTRTIDFSRCVACYNCIDSCDNHSISYHRMRARALQSSASAEMVPNPERRAFLLDAAAGVAAASTVSRPAAKSNMVCPPGAVSEERFLESCTACHLCVSECPSGVLQPTFMGFGWAGLMKPHLNFPAAYCLYDCQRCGEVCPDGAIDPLDVSIKHLTKIGEAEFHHDRCVVVTNHTDCAACSEHCPTKAVTTVPFGNDLRLPSLDPNLCIGCGACQYACPVKPEKAITVAGLRRHGLAKRFIEPKATLPKSSSDFPF